jgi:hypothetical protein
MRVLRLLRMTELKKRERSELRSEVKQVLRFAQDDSQIRSWSFGPLCSLRMTYGMRGRSRRAFVVSHPSHFGAMEAWSGFRCSGWGTRVLLWFGLKTTARAGTTARANNKSNSRSKSNSEGRGVWGWLLWFPTLRTLELAGRSGCDVLRMGHPGWGVVRVESAGGGAGGGGVRLRGAGGPGAAGYQRPQVRLM